MNIELYDNYKNRGRAILNKEKWGIWDNIISASLKNQMYFGRDLDAVLEIIPYKDDIDKAKMIFRSQKHSGFSASIVCSELRELFNDSVFVDNLFNDC